MASEQQQQEAKFETKKSLIVNFLPSTYTEDDMQAIFSTIGPLLNCKLVRNKETGLSLSYGFVSYEDQRLSDKAIHQLNGMKIQDKVIKVSYARPSNPDNQNSNVYIAGLPDWITEDKLLELFKTFGGVISHKVLQHADGTSRGAGLVRYTLSSEAVSAIEEMNGKLLPKATGPLSVKLAIPPAEKGGILQTIGKITANTILAGGSNRFHPFSVPQIRTPQTAVASALAELGVYNTTDATNHRASVYVSGLPEAATELTLFELFSPFGGVLNVKLIRDFDKAGQPCKGYGFVNYVKSEDATRAVKLMSGIPFQGKILQVSMKQTRGPPGA